MRAARATRDDTYGLDSSPGKTRGDAADLLDRPVHLLQQQNATPSLLGTCRVVTGGEGIDRFFIDIHTGGSRTRAGAGRRAGSRHDACRRGRQASWRAARGRDLGGSSDFSPAADPRGSPSCGASARKESRAPARKRRALPAQNPGTPAVSGSSRSRHSSGAEGMDIDKLFGKNARGTGLSSDAPGRARRSHPADKPDGAPSPNRCRDGSRGEGRSRQSTTHTGASRKGTGGRI